ncbi:CDGSH iron-sulfur domain-containing protein [Halovenus halobia]|uniref:CDGSH iron-sulfur domain-containing protein n=1 Tax=Halovenus halobia TaxID=3396622 RepID=UPI003F575896
MDESDFGNDGKAFICRRGLSEEKPLCDGSHKMTADKDEGTVNRYEDDSPDGERREIAETNYAEE